MLPNQDSSLARLAQGRFRPESRATATARATGASAVSGDGEGRPRVGDVGGAMGKRKREEENEIRAGRKVVCGDSRVYASGIRYGVGTRWKKAPGTTRGWGRGGWREEGEGQPGHKYTGATSGTRGGGRGGGGGSSRSHWCGRPEGRCNTRCCSAPDLGLASFARHTPRPQRRAHTLQCDGRAAADLDPGEERGARGAGSRSTASTSGGGGVPMGGGSGRPWPMRMNWLQEASRMFQCSARRRLFARAEHKGNGAGADRVLLRPEYNTEGSKHGNPAHRLWRRVGSRG